MARKVAEFDAWRGRSVAAALVAAACFAVLTPAAPVSARGGPPNFIDSDGYQRALRQERAQYRQAQQPQTQAVAPVPRHRHHRQHH